MIDFVEEKSVLHVLVGGEVWRSVPKRLFVKKVKGVESKEEFEKIEESIAFDAACRLLNVQPMLEAQVRKKLKAKKLSQKAINSACQKMEEYGYLDDSGLIERYILNEIEKGNGPYLIAAKLSQKQGRSVNEMVLSRITPKLEQKALEKALKKGKGKTREQLYAFLMRRGFRTDVIEI